MYQIFIKGLDGKTTCLQISTPFLKVSDLKNEIYDLIKIPQKFQRLVSGTRQIGENAVLVAAQDGFYPQVNLLLGLRGGKGGFGSLLRGAATKAGQKKTSNFDACRDMSGRRLRHVNAEKKLEEWKAEAQERQLEKVAEDYLKKQLKKEKKKKGEKGFDEGAVDVEKYRVEAERAMEGVESAVKDGLLEVLKLQKSGKRKMIENPGAVVRKRAKLWMLEEDHEDEEDEEDEVMEVSKQVVILMRGDEEGGSSNSSNAESVSDSEMAPVFGNTNKKPGCCDDVTEQQISNLSLNNHIQCDDGEANAEFKKSEFISLQGEDGNSCDEKEYTIELKNEIPFALTSKEEQNITCSYLGDDKESNVEVKTEEPISSLGESNSCDEKEATSVVTSECGKMDIICESQTNIGGLLKFEEFNTPKDMEVLGLERLKNELQYRGLKCGGSLSERAARLFLLKTTPLEHLHKKHFAMAKSVGK